METSRVLSALIPVTAAAALACVAPGRGDAPASPQDTWAAPAETAPAATASGPVADPRCTLSATGPDGQTGLDRALRGALERARFDQVIDLGPEGGPPRRAPIARRPSVDVAVIAFPEGCPPAFADAMISRDFEGVHTSRFDPATLAVKGVRFRRWDQDRWDGDAPPEPFTEADDVVPPRAGEAAIDFTVPYPASNFKLLVAAKILELAARGDLRLDDLFSHGKRSRSLRAWMADMITVSDDDSTQALVRALHAMGEAEKINELFERLGLSTLQMHDTSKTTGRSWHPGKFHMSAWDTARLLWLLDPDAPPPAWKAPGGAPVDRGFIGAESRRMLLGFMSEQAYQDVLGTAGLCGVPKTSRGIPALLPERWIPDERNGGDRSARAPDIRACNAAARVTFAHKTGLTHNFGSDAGIVRGIPGRARRHYIIAFFSNLGHRYTDADKASGPNPCEELGICYTQRIAALGAAVDAALAAAMDAAGSGDPAPR
jgi:hypothetical protein